MSFRWVPIITEPSKVRSELGSAFTQGSPITPSHTKPGFTKIPRYWPLTDVASSAITTASSTNRRINSPQHAHHPSWSLETCCSEQAEVLNYPRGSALRFSGVMVREGLDQEPHLRVTLCDVMPWRVLVGAALASEHIADRRCEGREG